MTREDIIALAREAGMVRLLDEHAHEYGNGMFENTEYPQLEKFAALVAAAERAEVERLKLLCEEMLRELYVYRASEYLKDVTAAIRAKGETK